MTDIFFGNGAIVLWIAILVVIVLAPVRKRFIKFILSDEFMALRLVMVLSLIAMMGSLWYSDVMGYAPCRLCWYQRIFMYPIPLISFVGLVWQDIRALLYVKVLAVIGAVISLFHIAEQRLPKIGLSCDTVGQSASCDTLHVNVYNIITIPAMALTIFTAILVIIILLEKNSPNIYGKDRN